jgi:hypothetical protein
MSKAARLRSFLIELDQIGEVCSKGRSIATYTQASNGKDFYTHGTSGTVGPAYRGFDVCTAPLPSRGKGGS